MLPSPPRDIEENTNATLQLVYTSDANGTGPNETYYACSDIRYVPVSNFSAQIPCFNVSSDDFVVGNNTTTGKTGSVTLSTLPSTATTAPNSETSALAADGASSGLPGGAIAGIVVGVVLGLVVLAAAGFFIYRSRQRELRAREAAANARKWTGAEAASERGGSHELRNL